MDSTIMKEIFMDLPRFSPGGDQWTIKALRIMGTLPKAPDVLCVGCGEGDEVLTIANTIPKAIITGIDIEPRYLEALRIKAEKRMISDRIKTVCCPMEQVPFDHGTFDIIWSEGSVYIAGFAECAAKWKPLLRNGGWLAVTDLVWQTTAPHKRAADFWHAAYPGMSTESMRMSCLQSIGYQKTKSFPLPGSAWWESYYTPLEKRLDKLKIKYSGNPEALTAIAAVSTEISIRRKYGNDYTYAFFIGQS